jgi:hypothetical protein
VCDIDPEEFREYLRYLEPAPEAVPGRTRRAAPEEWLRAADPEAIAA